MALSAKHQLFVETYLQKFNSTDAYLAVSPNVNRATAASNGYRLLKESKEIAAAVSARIGETAMLADEVLSRLAAEARGDVDDFLDEEGNFDLKKARLAKKTGLIKKLKTKTTTRTIGDAEIKTVEVEFELHDAQAALVHLGKYHKLFADRTELTGKDGGPIQSEQSVKPDLSKLTVDELLQLRTMVAKATDAATDVK